MPEIKAAAEGPRGAAPAAAAPPKPAEAARGPARRRHRRVITLPEHMQPAGSRRRRRGVFAAIAAFWLMSDLGYYAGLPALGIAPDYNAAPVAIAVYYLFWCGLAVIAFWPIYTLWSREAPWPALANRSVAALLWTGMFAAAAGYAVLLVPRLPPLDWPEALGPVPDVAAAGPLYFLPKTADIAFQQLLVLALVLALAAEGLTLRRIMLACAVMFGGMHLLLLPFYPFEGVLRFTLFAAAFGALLPVLLLRVPYGLALGFALHWAYYAVTLAQVRLFGPAVLWRLIGGG